MLNSGNPSAAVQVDAPTNLGVPRPSINNL